MKGLCIISLVIVTALTVFMLGYVLFRGVPHITSELLFTSPSMLRHTIGILPDIRCLRHMDILSGGYGKCSFRRIFPLVNPVFGEGGAYW